MRTYRLDEIEPLEWDPRPSICVVMASEGYPASYEKGRPISGLGSAAELEDVKVFHAGTHLKDGAVVKPTVNEKVEPSKDKRG